MSTRYANENRSFAGKRSRPYHPRDAYEYGYTQNVDCHEALAPLIKRMQWYDTARLDLEREGGAIADLKNITTTLNTPMTLRGRYACKEVRLTDQGSLRGILWDIDTDLHLDVRLRATGMPAYYLCRTRADYWSEYSLIVEDLYMSPGYPVTDERFINLMHAGHEVFFLRLSPFRDGAQAMSNSEDDTATDALLYSLGRHVFQAAWHEDQRLGIMAANHLELTSFRYAIELLYLCLGAELCELRGAVTERMLKFFEAVYPQPAIRAFLKMLATLDGGALNELPQRARQHYKRLLAAFSQFLATEIPWGARPQQMPLWKVLYGNFSRLDAIGSALRQDPALVRASTKLDRAAVAVVSELGRLPNAANVAEAG